MRSRLLPALLLAAALAVAPAAAADADAAREVPLRIIAINDLHGHLEAGDNAVLLPDPADPARSLPLRSGGLAALATAVRRLRAEVRHSVFVSAGDLIGASPLVSALFRDEPTIEAMNLLGLDLNVAGNHEFDQGVTELRRLIDGGCAQTPRGELATCSHPSGRYGGARFPFLAANVVDAEERPLLPASHTIDVAGIRLAFIGAVTRSTPGIVMPAGIRGWRFTDEAAAINREAARLRAQGVLALVAVVHEGGEADGGINGCERPRGPVFEIAAALDRDIPLLLSAHTHRAYNCRSGPRVIVQGASYGRLLSLVDLRLDRRSGRIVEGSLQARNLPVPNGLGSADDALHRAHPPLAPAADIAAHVDHYRQRAAPLADRPLGRLAGRFDRQPGAGGDHAAGRLVADAQLEATRENGAQIAFTNPGGVRSDLAPRGADGSVSFADAFTMQPFGNTLVTLTLTGAQLKELLESQWRGDAGRARLLQPSRGFGYAWRAGAAPGGRIDPESLRLHGKRIEPARDYRVTVNSYLAAGGDGFALFLLGTDRRGGPLDIDALADYLRRHARNEPLAPDLLPRIRRLP